MKHNHRYNKNKVKNIKSTRTIILFIIIAAFVVVSSTLMAMKVSESKQAVQALEVNKETNQETNSELSGEDNINTKNESNINLYSLENDPVADDIAFVEKYLDQQMKGDKCLMEQMVKKLFI